MGYRVGDLILIPFRGRKAVAKIVYNDAKSTFIRNEKYKVLVADDALGGVGYKFIYKEFIFGKFEFKSKIVWAIK